MQCTVCNTQWTAVEDIPGRTGNRLTGNRLTGNRLTGNRLTGNRLTGNRLTETFCCFQSGCDSCCNEITNSCVDIHTLSRSLPRSLSHTQSILNLSGSPRAVFPASEMSWSYHGLVYHVQWDRTFWEHCAVTYMLPSVSRKGEQVVTGTEWDVVIVRALDISK
jgi:hypothetical protein